MKKRKKETCRERSRTKRPAWMEGEALVEFSNRAAAFAYESYLQAGPGLVIGTLQGDGRAPAPVQLSYTAFASQPELVATLLQAGPDYLGYKPEEEYMYAVQVAGNLEIKLYPGEKDDRTGILRPRAAYEAGWHQRPGGSFRMQRPGVTPNA